MNYHKIEYDNMLNGEGIRAVLYVAGCTHHCKGCQNPQTWDINSGKKFTDDDFNEISAYMYNDYVSGLTLSGGDPLCMNNFKTVRHICQTFKARHRSRGKTIWLYTGYTIEQILNNEILRSILEFVDILVDGKYVEELADRDYHWAGSTNQRIIDVKKTLEQKKVVLYED